VVVAVGITHRTETIVTVPVTAKLRVPRCRFLGLSLLWLRSEL